ncbi:MAG: hypothetical protein HWN68_12445 [Desulfobacterales bacterium]|nr:hypothetical protein [Desulfobacterales bacterium]
MFDIVVFFGGSYAAKGTIDFSRNPPQIEYTQRLMKEGVGVSTCIPMYVNQIVEVEQTYLELGENGNLTAEKLLTDEAVINNSTIANWVMTFSEFYLAYKLAGSEEPPQILLLDRSLLTMVSSLIYDTRRRRIWNASAFIGLETDGEKIDENDILYNRHRIVNKNLKLPTARGDYLRYALAYLIEEKGPISFEEICEELDINTEGRRKRAHRFLSRAVTEGYLQENDEIYEVAPRYKDSWSRVKKAVETLGKQLFEEPAGDNPMQVERDGEKRWLTTLDLAFLSLFCINMLIEECWRRNILLVGITKDTTARDFKTHLIPVCLNEGIWSYSQPMTMLERAPNTDRMLLQYLSALNHERLPTPWALVEYDSAFRMIIPELKKRRKGYVSGAIRNRIIYERLFLKTYIQLSEASTDPQLRSNVLFIDRLVYPDYDLRPETTFHFKHQYGGAEEPVDVILYRDRNVENPLQNLIMVMLKAMAKSSIPEVFGHNMPLFIADKIAKWHYGEIRRIIDSARVWVSNNPGLRRHLFFMSTFRERRTELEQSRRRS